MSIPFTNTQRVAYSTDATVNQECDNRFTIEIPGVSVQDRF